MEELEQAKKSIIAVGEGRGFVVNTDPRFVITAAHCLPQLPPACAVSSLEERIYPELLGRTVERKRTIWAECYFADPVSDIAVLGQPDNQELYNQAEAYDNLVVNSFALNVGEPPDQSGAWLLGLDGQWGECIVNHAGSGRLWLEDVVNGIVGGMSGSPIVNDEGAAIGILGVSSGSADELHAKGGPQAGLRHNLPGWLLLEFGF